ncbi:hypothetical protein DPMN_110325 [Dreissena polymorpha]|uniref:Uncharacterized protein n=1 Tax=Dreissena polymorpha TaxID=45954 RepID=A0A9D4KCF8_DREPO|nr:hypothetical protein DPMN_110325 [Dreissena polymorpha]
MLGRSAVYDQSEFTNDHVTKTNKRYKCYQVRLQIQTAEALSRASTFSDKQPGFVTLGTVSLLLNRYSVGCDALVPSSGI